ncbi:hypothetical protein FVE85_1222 [Porphyridium purpureum]|uniref:Uncharacterized protein n=1 Tax=Porphyridium purpureum TaxID=35688 RepID=A0A5J4YFV2_PORPP|nr:hypothetical protein FVE85_1222 [Porphyridium purpureum]|eukprot:POR4517..scf218_34
MDEDAMPPPGYAKSLSQKFEQGFANASPDAAREVAADAPAVSVSEGVRSLSQKFESSGSKPDVATEAAAAIPSSSSMFKSASQKFEAAPVEASAATPTSSSSGGGGVRSLSQKFMVPETAQDTQTPLIKSLSQKYSEGSTTPAQADPMPERVVTGGSSDMVRGLSQKYSEGPRTPVNDDDSMPERTVTTGSTDMVKSLSQRFEQGAVTDMASEPESASGMMSAPVEEEPKSQSSVGVRSLSQRFEGGSVEAAAVATAAAVEADEDEDEDEDGDAVLAEAEHEEPKSHGSTVRSLSQKFESNAVSAAVAEEEAEENADDQMDQALDPEDTAAMAADVANEDSDVDSDADSDAEVEAARDSVKSREAAVPPVRTESAKLRAFERDESALPFMDDEGNFYGPAPESVTTVLSDETVNVSTVGHTGTPLEFCWVNDNLAFSAGEDGKVVLWDVNSCEALLAFVPHAGEPVGVMALLPTREVDGGKVLNLLTFSEESRIFKKWKVSARNARLMHSVPLPEKNGTRSMISFAESLDAVDISDFYELDDDGELAPEYDPAVVFAPQEDEADVAQQDDEEAVDGDAALEPDSEILEGEEADLEDEQPGDAAANDSEDVAFATRAPPIDADSGDAATEDALSKGTVRGLSTGFEGGAGADNESAALAQDQAMASVAEEAPPTEEEVAPAPAKNSLASRFAMFENNMGSQVEEKKTIPVEHSDEMKSRFAMFNEKVAMPLSDSEDVVEPEAAATAPKLTESIEEAVPEAPRTKSIKDLMGAFDGSSPSAPEERGVVPDREISRGKSVKDMMSAFDGSGSAVKEPEDIVENVAVAAPETVPVDARADPPADDAGSSFKNAFAMFGGK